eukprot:TRINITY_DN1396_c0_g1_i2.p1 TRINITY_DN1396_c0_g1~~TRINITY_DN1396_c0_g1_i2.p1  ORF type:complete len:239 (-),score=18.18 TRINITY_DN1396_c0_g1_i2:713-1429(-)
MSRSPTPQLVTFPRMMIQGSTDRCVLWMEEKAMVQGRSAWQRQRWVCGIALALLLSAGAVVEPAAAKQLKPAAVFVVGDSYSDTGNRNRSDARTNQSWAYPYGISWKPGRFSDGRVSTDYLVDFFGLPPLKTYASISKGTPPGKLKQGVNFATGGAGAFPVGIPVPSFAQQVEQLKQVVGAYPNLFSPHKSVVIMSSSGNDYTQFRFDHPNATVPVSLFLHLHQGLAATTVGSPLPPS